MSKVILLISLFMFTHLLSHAQGISNNILLNSGNTTICEGDIVTIVIEYAYPSSGSPISATPIIMQDRLYAAGASMCYYAPPNFFFNASESQPLVTGENVISRVATFTGASCNPTYKLTIKAKPTSSGSYSVHWQSRYAYGTGNFWNYAAGSYTDYIYNGTFNITVNKVNKPTVKANKALLLAGEQATLTATGMSPTVTTLQYQWKTGCADAPWIPGGNPIQVNPGTYKVRFVENGCIGDSSDPITVLAETASPIALGCNNVEAQNIYLFTRAGDDGRMDYHHYYVETTICQTGPNMPNCTLDSVWRKLKKSVWNNAPLVRDFVPAAGTTLPVIFSDVLFQAQTTNGTNCNTIILPGPSSNHITFIAMAQVCGFTASFNNYINALIGTTPIANPITQTIDEATHSITNYTLPGHMLYPGRIIRTVVLECGVIKIKTVGIGRSWVGNNVCGKKMAEINTYVGKIVFSNIDQRVIASN